MNVHTEAVKTVAGQILLLGMVGMFAAWLVPSMVVGGALALVGYREKR